MRRFLIYAIAAVCSIAALGQGGVLHGIGDPRTLVPTPNCAQSRFYVDDSSGKMYQANSGSPCAWTDPSTATGGGGTFAPAGTILSTASFSSLSGWTANGTTPTVSGGKLNFSGGASDYTHTLDYNQVTLLPQWTMCGNIVIASGSDAIGFGLRSNQAGAAYYSVTSQYNQANGKVFVLTVSGTTGTVSATSSGTLSVTVGDTVQMCINRAFDTMTVTGQDLTTNSAQISTTFKYLFAYQQSAIMPNVGKFAIYNFGGTPSVSSFSITSPVSIYSTLAVLGDSKTVGYYAGTYNLAYATLLQNNYSEVTLAGGSNQSADMVAELPEAIALKPTYAIIATYRNDTGVCSNTAPGATTANLASTFSQLQAAGVTPYFLIGMWEPTGSCNQAAIWSWITTNYPSNYIDTGYDNYGGTTSGLVVADNIHPNSTFHALIYQAIQNKLMALGVKNLYQSYVNYSLAQTGGATGGSFSTLSVSGTANFGNNSNTQGIVTVGHCQANPSVPFSVCVDQAMSGGANVQPVFIGSNDATNPFVINLNMTGNGTAANRIWDYQTQQAGLSNSGIARFQFSGGYFIDGMVTTVSALPTCSATFKGAKASVTDATAPTYLGALTGGGAVVTPVFCNGAAWLSY